MKHIIYIIPHAVSVLNKLLFYSSLLTIGFFGLIGCNENDLIEPTTYTTLRGRVLDITTQQVVSSALVTLSPSGRVLSTNALGEFRFDSVTAGSYTIQAIKTGFVSQTASVSATTDVIPAITILLNRIQSSSNQPPTTPILVSPALNSTTTATGLTVKWKATDPNRDTLTYDVLFYKVGISTPALSYTGLQTDSLVVPTLDYSTTYFWQVIAKDKSSATNGPLWTFTTASLPDFSYAFTRLVNGQYQIFASNGGSSAIQLTRNGSNWRPIASPNRQQIAYISTAANDLHLYVMNADGSNQRQVTSIPLNGLSATDLSFCWSPDGSQLLYPSNNRLYVIRTDGSGLRLVSQAAAGRLFAGCDWTAQGDEIVARTTGATIYDNELTIFRTDGSTSRSVFVQRNRRVGNPVYSVDGRQLVFSVDSSGFMNEQGRQLDARLHLLTLSTNSIVDLSVPQSTTQTGGTTQVTKAPGTNDLDPKFSPSGSQIIFTNSVNTLISERSVYVINLNGSRVTNRQLLIGSADMPYWRRQ